jgi:hypothetical protein
LNTYESRVAPIAVVARVPPSMVLWLSGYSYPIERSRATPDASVSYL